MMILQLAVSEKGIWAWEAIKTKKTALCGIIKFFSLLFIVIISTCVDTGLHF